MPEIKRRHFNLDNVKVRGGENGEPVKMTGHAAVFNQRSENMGWGDINVFEEIKPGAFTRTLKEGGFFKDGIQSYFNHDSHYILASTEAGSLRLWEDETGLAFEMEPIDTPTIRDLLITPMERGLINKMSFGFVIPQGGETMHRSDAETLYEVSDVDLIEISPVIRPAYPQTDVGVRSLLEHHGIDPNRAIELLTFERNLPEPEPTGEPEPEGENQRAAAKLEIERLRRLVDIA